VLDPPRAIAWLTGYDKGDGELEFGGWIPPFGPGHHVNSLRHLAELAAHPIDHTRGAS
jgi:hypothetical protein